MNATGPSRFFLLLFALPATFVVSASFAEETEPVRHLGVGINTGGAQLDWRPTERWMFEARGQTAKASADSGELRSLALGLRTYRFFRPAAKVSPYLGNQISYLETTESTGLHKTSGGSVGAFGGVSLKLNSRFSLGFDIGPYLIRLTEKNSGTGQSSLDFVGDGALIFFF